MNAAGISDRGRIREKNEDRYLIHSFEPFNLYAVADGMGGHASGEVASTLALEAIRSYLEEKGHALVENRFEGMPEFMLSMLSHANRKVHEVSLSDLAHTGMGTTLTLLFGIPGMFWLGHIGDSRAYLINGEGTFHLTEDHTLVTQLVRSGQISEDETNGHPQRHILTRALGTDNSENFDIIQLSYKPGDAVLLCSDGLYSMVDNNEIGRVILSEKDPQRALGRLVDLANERGGTDNITAVLVWLRQ